MEMVGDEVYFTKKINLLLKIVAHYQGHIGLTRSGPRRGPGPN